MKLLIGKIIRDLRQSHGITQEELAQHLGLSFQAISKWERGDGYPEITMLPRLASFFEISVDDLLGMKELKTADKLQKINDEWEDNRNAGRHIENVKLMRDALEIWPTEPILLIQLSASLERLGGDEDSKRRYLLESIKLQESALGYCTDPQLCTTLLFNLADSWLKIGEKRRAVDYARKLPNIYKIRETALVRILEDKDEQQMLSQHALQGIIWTLAFHLNILAETTKSVTFYTQIISVINTLFENDKPNWALQIINETKKKLE